MEGFHVDSLFKSKAIFTALTSVASVYLGIINEIFFVFCFMTILDYFTGTVAAKRKNKWTKAKAVQGMWEKFGFFILITLACTLDFTVSFIGSKMNETFTTHKGFTFIVLIWLIGTEGRSNLKNLKAWGIKVPKFLVNGFTQLQKSSEDIENKK